MGVLVHWSDEKVTDTAARLGKSWDCARGRDHVRRVLNEADAVPRDLHQGAVEARADAHALLRRMREGRGVPLFNAEIDRVLGGR